MRNDTRFFIFRIRNEMTEKHFETESFFNILIWEKS